MAAVEKYYIATVICDDPAIAPLYETLYVTSKIAVGDTIRDSSYNNPCVVLGISMVSDSGGQATVILTLRRSQ